MPFDVDSGAVVAGFRVLSLIGEGAMGSVYLSEETASGRRVALKLLAPELARDERFRRRFLRETEIAASIEHPHVVSTLAAGEADGVLYLAMVYVEGSDLREILRDVGRLEPGHAVELISRVADALGKPLIGAGTIDSVATFDEATGDLVSYSESVHGPHPLRDGVDICTPATTYLTSP